MERRSASWSFRVSTRWALSARHRWPDPDALGPRRSRALLRSTQVAAAAAERGEASGRQVYTRPRDGLCSVATLIPSSPRPRRPRAAWLWRAAAPKPPRARLRRSARPAEAGGVGAALSTRCDGCTEQRAPGAWPTSTCAFWACIDGLLASPAAATCFRASCCADAPWLRIAGSGTARPFTGE